MRTVRPLLATLLLVPVAALGLPRDADACMIVGRNGAQISVADEEVLIIWDEANHKEHFIRKLAFDANTPDFGFLVPTPTQPTLAAAPDAAFARIAEFYSRPVPRAVPQRARGADGFALTAAAAAPVQVIARQQVAGLDATILRATDAEALTAWLRERQYDAPPGMREYLAGYVSRGWYFTAFKYRGGGPVTAQSVRLSFDATEPFFPYAEPQPTRARTSNRSFRLSIVANARMKATAGSAQWVARTAFAGRPRGLVAALEGVLPAGATSGAWMTTFQEDNSTRGREDLVFSRAPEQTNVAPSIPRR